MSAASASTSTHLCPHPKHPTQPLVEICVGLDLAPASADAAVHQLHAVVCHVPFTLSMITQTCGYAHNREHNTVYMFDVRKHRHDTSHFIATAMYAPRDCAT